MTKVTDWIPCSINPVRVGWYEWHELFKPQNLMYPVMRHWWDGKNWKFGPDINQAFYNQHFGYWRGLKK